MAWIICFDIAAAMNQEKMATGGTPSNTINNVSGAIVDVSSVPEINPTPENIIPPAKAIPRAQSKSLNIKPSIMSHLLLAGCSGFVQYVPAHKIIHITLNLSFPEVPLDLHILILLFPS